MAKAVVTCTCSTCGKEFSKSKQCSNRSEADSFEKWARENIDTCPDCYRQLMRKKESEKGLLVEYSIDLNEAYHGNLCEIATFSGDTYSSKEKLKKFGCEYSHILKKWSYSFPVTLENPKDFDIEFRIESELDAKKIGYNQYERQLKYALKVIKEYNNKVRDKQKELDELGEEPKFPKEFITLRNGRKWNGNFYGGKVTYFDGEKVIISSELVKKVQTIMVQRMEWENKKRSIENKYL